MSAEHVNKDMLAYLEPSAVDALVRAAVSGSEARGVLAAKGYVPAIGLHVLHELARTLVYGKGSGGALFRFVLDISPTILQEPWELLRQELGLLDGGGPVDPFLESDRTSWVMGTVALLERGEVNEELRQQIISRDTSRATDWPQSSEEYMTQIRALRRDDPAALPQFTTHADVVAFFRPSFADFLASRAECPVPVHLAGNVAALLDEFPAYRTDLYLWMYLILICIRDKRVPSHDRLDDFRHLVEGAYCRAFVTNDYGLLFAAKEIAPQLELLPFGSSSM